MLALSGCGVMRSGVGGNEGPHHVQRQVVRLQTSGKITKRADIATTVGGAAGTAQSLTRIRDVGRVIIGDLLSHTYIAESEQTIAGAVSRIPALGSQEWLIKSSMLPCGNK